MNMLVLGLLAFIVASFLVFAATDVLNVFRVKMGLITEEERGERYWRGWRAFCFLYVFFLVMVFGCLVATNISFSK
jgi:hypothetical protein